MPNHAPDNATHPHQTHATTSHHAATRHRSHRPPTPAAPAPPRRAQQPHGDTSRTRQLIHATNTRTALRPTSNTGITLVPGRQAQRRQNPRQTNPQGLRRSHRRMRLRPMRTLHHQTQSLGDATYAARTPSATNRSSESIASMSRPSYKRLGAGWEIGAPSSNFNPAARWR